MQTPTFVPILFSFFMMGAAFFTGINSGLARSTSHLYVNTIGIAAAISSQALGLKSYPYEGYRSALEALQQNGFAITPQNFPNGFRDYPALTKGLEAAKVADTCGSGLIFHPYNDQGITDFIRDSFSLFGIDVVSMYFFYFVLVAISMGIFIASFWRSYVACSLLFCCAIALYSFMPSYLYNNDQLISISNPRFLSTMGIIPALHLLIAFTSMHSERISWLKVFGIVFQSAFISFVVSVRSTALWMEIALALIALFYFVGGAMSSIKRRSKQPLTSFLFTRGAVALYIVATIMTADAVRGLYLQPNCGTGLNAHTFWHNVFIGLSFNPEWEQHVREEYGVPKGTQGDDIPFTVAKIFAQRNHLPYVTDPSIWVPPSDSRLGADLIPFGSWVDYEHILKLATFDFVRTHLTYTVEAFVIYKPLVFFSDLGAYFADLLKNLFFIKLAAIILMCAAIGAYVPAKCLWLRSFDSEIGVRQAVGAVIIFFLLSTVPLMVAYPDDFLICDPAFLAVTGISLCLILAVAKERSRARQRKMVAAI